MSHAWRSTKCGGEYRFPRLNSGSCPQFGSRAHDDLLTIPQIPSATYSRLHTPPAGADYALGWETLEETCADGRVLAHIGTNTVWYASVWLAPERDLGLFAVTNAGGDDAARATEAAVTEMIARLDRLVGS